MLDPGVAYVNVIDVFPDVTGVNASGPSTTDGFEFVANFVNDNNLGVGQMLLDHAGLAPNGVVESASASQIKEALQKGFGAPPGVSTMWDLADDPGTTGHRCIFKNGQGVLRANYPDLDAANYVGDGNNAAAAAQGGGYYHADDAAGTIPNTAGIYLIIPESRGYSPRGLDPAASVDPDGASRYAGDNQDDAFQGHWHGAETRYVAHTLVAGATSNVAENTGGPQVDLVVDAISDTVNGIPRTDSETRMVNFSTKFVVWY